MNDFCLVFGKAIVICGGTLLALCIIGFLGELVYELWTDAIWHARIISKSEKLIIDYRRNAPEFKAWLEEKKKNSDNEKQEYVGYQPKGSGKIPNPPTSGSNAVLPKDREVK